MTAMQKIPTHGRRHSLEMSSFGVVLVVSVLMVQEMDHYRDFLFCNSFFF
jgi:hypothetical protein